MSTADATAAAATPESPADSEYAREPVPPVAQRGWRSFLGMYAGEHVAGTEFMIGPLFVARGVSAFDLLVGLLLGNLLAVLSWRYLTAPIAARCRLTLYYQLERICGGRLVALYNLANGIMFCALAGAMVAVSATAVGVPFALRMPELTDVYPTGVGWVVAVFAVGFVIAVVAARGYDAVARFSDRCALWMIAAFFACGVAAIPQLSPNGLADLPELANTVIWTGNPLPGQPRFTFLHVMFFAWFANMAMHIGMADLSILRFARKPAIAWSSAVGMFVGHYMAWIAASLLYAAQLKADPSNTAVAPGPMAYGVAGWAGITCVVIAGWTTANPTIYRAGLAFGALAPRRTRTQMTFVAGIVATVAALFPAIVMRLLDFVALYGLVLMPMGAVIFVDFWVLPRFGLRREHALASGSTFYPAAAIAWLVTLAVCVGATARGNIEIFFVALPGWFVAALLYLAASFALQRSGRSARAGVAS